MPNRPPDFIVIGAMKAGTTSLHSYLRSHPQIGMPRRKELDWFSARGRVDRAGYERLFRRCHGTVLGEASPSYAMYPRFGDTAERIRRALPDVKLIYAIRDPLERMRSHYHHEVLRSRETRPASIALRDDSYLRPSLYGFQLSRFADRFPSEQIAVVSADALREDRAAVLREVYDYLGVDPTWTDASLQGELFRSDSRMAIPPGLERVRQLAGVKAVLGHVDLPTKQRLGLVVRRVRQGRDDLRVVPLVQSIDDWEPTSFQRDLLDEDADLLDKVCRGCRMIPDEFRLPRVDESLQRGAAGDLW